MSERYWRCLVCGTITKDGELLRAPSPFNAADTLVGCPHCKTADDFEEMCDEPGCDREATCGFPVPRGYRRTCFDHSSFKAHVS